MSSIFIFDPVGVDQTKFEFRVDRTKMDCKTTWTYIEFLTSLSLLCIIFFFTYVKTNLLKWAHVCGLNCHKPKSITSKPNTTCNRKP